MLHILAEKPLVTANIDLKEILKRDQSMAAFMRGFYILTAAFTMFSGTSLHADELTLDDVHKLRKFTLEARNTSEARLDEEELQTKQRLLDYALQPERDANFHLKVRCRAKTALTGCASGDWNACHSLAKMYKTQQGAQLDRPLAFALFWLGCRVEHNGSCVGMMSDQITELFRYEGTRPEVKVYSTACADGDHHACYLLASYYSGVRTGRNLEKDEDLQKSLHPKGMRT